MVLPQPLSPTRPSVSPGSIVKLTPSTARTTRRRRGQDAGEEAVAEGEVLDEILDGQQGHGGSGSGLYAHQVAGGALAGRGRSERGLLDVAARLGDGQRGWKRQPGGTALSPGITPGMAPRRPSRPGRAGTR